MARSSVLALCILLAACTSAVAPASSRPPRALATTPFDPASVAYPATAASFMTALNEGRAADAVALIGEHFTGSDCDYQSRSVWYMSDRENARYWLQRRIAEHDRIEVLNTLDGGSYDHAARFEVRRASDPIRLIAAGGSVVPRAKLVLRFTLDGTQIVQWGWEWNRYGTLVSAFSDCLP